MGRTNYKAEDILSSGDHFDYWTVQALGTKLGYLKCICKCGVEREVNVYSLTSGKSRSCGCRILDEQKLNMENTNQGPRLVRIPDPEKYGNLEDYTKIDLG